jgi:LacI family transcriptional regulator
VRDGKLKLIAAEAGISPNTVLRVLRGENKERWPSAIRRAAEIRRIAMKHGYLPNGSARAMRRGRFNCMALLLSTDRGRSYLPDELFNGIHDALHDHSMRLVISKLADEQLTSGQVMPAILREWSCDGLLINYTDRVPPEMVQLIGKYHIPSVWINRKQENDCIYYDDRGGAEAGTRHLIEQGHRGIAYLDFIPRDRWHNSHYSHADRHDGYSRAMLAAGLTPMPREAFADVDVAERLDATVALLKGERRPTALVCYDTGARALLAAALAGLQVPRDLSILTFAPQRGDAGGRRGESFLGRAVGQMGLPVEDAGHNAVDLLLRKIAAPAEKLPACVLPLKLDPGDTCGPAPVEKWQS